MADIKDSLGRSISDETNLTIGDLKKLLLGLKTESKETKNSNSDFSELRKILESTFKDFKSEIEKLNSNMEAANKLDKKRSSKPNKPSTSTAGDDENDDKEIDNRLKMYGYRARRALSDLGSMTDSLFVGVGDAYGKLFKGIVSDERKFVITQKEIAYETQGALNQNTKLMSTYTDLEKTVSKTGVSREEFQKSYTDAIKSGNRDLKVAKALTTAQLNTEKQLGIEVGGLSDTFQKLNTQFGMSEMQIAEMGRGMREVAKSSGLTGTALKRAVETSTQFMEMMRNAGQLTSLAAKNIQAISASAQKFGIEKELSPLIQALSSSSNLILESSEQTKNLLFIAGNYVGRVSDVLNGTVLKTKQGTKDIALGLRKVLADFGVQSLEAVENLTDQEKFRINLSLKSAFGIEVDQAKRQILALEEGSKTYAEKLADLNKEMKKNLTMEEKAIIKEKERSIKLSASLGLLTALDEASKSAKNMGEAYSNFNAKAANYADELNALGLTAKSEKDIAKGAFISAITNINKSLESTGKKPLNISSKEIEKAINNPEAMRQLSAKLSAAEQEAATAAKAQLDPAKRMEQLLMEGNDYFKTWSNKVLSFLSASSIGNILASVGTIGNILVTSIGKGLNLYSEFGTIKETFTGLRKVLEQKFASMRTPAGATVSGMAAAKEPTVPNEAEKKTASAVEMGTTPGSFYTHDTHAEKILNLMLESLRSTNQIIHKIASNPSMTGVAGGPKTIAEQKTLGQMKFAQYEGDPAAKALQKSKDRHERKMIKEEKIMNKKKMKNIKDETHVAKAEKSSILNQGGFEIMGFDLSALQGQGTQMIKAAPSLMILGIGAMLLGSALIWVCNKIITALGIDISTILETAGIITAIVGVTAALMAAVTETKETLSNNTFADFQKTAWNLTKNLVKSAPALFALGIAVVTLGAGLIWAANQILSVMGIDNETIMSTAETITYLLGGLAIIAGAVGLASIGLEKLNKYMPFNQLGKFAKEIAVGALTLTLLTLPLLTLSAVLMQFCSGILSILGIDTQTIDATVNTVSSLLFGLASIATGVALSVLALAAIGAGVAALFFDPSGTTLLIAVTLLALGSIALGVLLPVMITAASVLMNFCSGILSSLSIDPQKINSTVELVSTLLKGLASIATSVGIAALGLLALGGGAAGLILGGPLAVGVFLGLLNLGTAALALLAPVMIAAANVVMGICASMLQIAGVNETDIKKTVETTNILFDGLKDLISGFATSSMYLLAFLAPTTLALIALGFFVALPLLTTFLKQVSPFISEFTATLINLVGSVSKSVGGMGNVDYVRRFAEDMNRAINAVVDMLKIIGSSLYQLGAKSWFGFGSSLIDDILEYSKGFSEAMEIICRDVIKNGIIDPINTNFNKIGIKKTKQALYTAMLIGKTMTSISNMLISLSDMTAKFNKKAVWWKPLGNTVIEELRETSDSFSKNFKKIIKTVNEGIIVPISEEFRNLKPISVAATAARGLSVVFTSLAQFMTVLKEKIKPLTDEKSTGIPFWYSNDITDLSKSMDMLGEPLMKVFNASKGLLDSIKVGQQELKQLRQALPALQMLTQLVDFTGTLVTKLQPLASMAGDTSVKNQFKQTGSRIPFFQRYKTDMEILVEELGKFSDGFSKIIDSLKPIIDKMYISGETMDKKNDRLEIAIKRLGQFAEFSSKMAKIVEDYNKSAETSKNIKAQEGGFTMATKNITIAIDESMKFVEIIIDKIGEADFAKIKTATVIAGTLGNFTKALSYLIESLSDAMGEIFGLQQEMYNMGSKATKTTGGGKQIVSGESDKQWGNLNVDELSSFLQETTGFAINFATSIITAIDKQPLPDIKGLNQSITKIKSLIDAVYLIGKMMEVLQEVFVSQENLNKTLGGGKVDGQDRGNQIRQIKTHMGEKMDSVIELGVGVIEKINSLNIGELKNAKEAVQKFHTCIIAVQSVGFLMRVLVGDSKNTGLIDLTNELNTQMKKFQENKGETPDKNAIANIKDTLGEYIDPVIDLSQFITDSVGEKLKNLSPDHVKKLEMVAEMLYILRYITIALRDMLMSKTETIVVGGIEKKASMLEALSEGKDAYIEYFKRLGEMMQGIVHAIEDYFIDPSQIEAVKTKILATWEVTSNLAILLNSIHKDMNKIFKDYMTYGINTYNAFRSFSPNPMQDTGEGTNKYCAEPIVEYFADPSDWNNAIEFVQSTKDGLEALVDNLLKVHQLMNKAFKDYMSFGINTYIGFRQGNPMPMIHTGEGTNNYFVQQIIETFAESDSWQAAIYLASVAADGLEKLVVELEKIHPLMSKAFKDYMSFGINTYMAFRQGNPMPMQDVGDGTNKYLVQQIIETFAGSANWDAAIELVGFAVTGLNRLVYDLERIHISTDQIMRIYKGFKSLDELKENRPFEYMGRVLWNHIYVGVNDNFPRDNNWSAVLQIVKFSQDSLYDLNDMLVAIENSVSEVILTSRDINSIEFDDVIEKLGNGIMSNIIIPTLRFMPSSLTMSLAVNTIDTVTKGLIAISGSLLMMKDALEVIGNLNIASSLGKMFAGFAGVSGISMLNPFNAISAMFSGNVDPVQEIRREKATTETVVKSDSSMEQLTSINQQQLDAQLEMVEILEEIRDNLQSGSELSGESELGDSDTSSRKIQKKPINLYKWGAGQFHRGAGYNLTNTGIKGV